MRTVGCTRKPEAIVDDCLFCQIARGEEPGSFVLRTPEVFAMVDPRQFHDGHVLVIPVDHIPDITELPDRLAGPLMSAVSQVSAAVRRTYAAEGLSLWHSVGEAAYQEVPHLHIHVHPRRAGDQMLRPYPERPRSPDRTELDAIAERLHGQLESSAD